MSTPTHAVTFYVQIDPVFTGSGKVMQLKAIRMTQKRPVRQQGGTALVKLTVEVPDAAFMPLRPEVTIVVPEDMVATQPIEVEAGDANDDTGLF